ncbi:hypothetical protein B0H11DRAFT_1912587 [Mycena galericulata]|nr:hypothetical protein B0H11DRAFT_1912587 [Mycena galericulata]
MLPVRLKRRQRIPFKVRRISNKESVRIPSIDCTQAVTPSLRHAESRAGVPEEVRVDQFWRKKQEVIIQFEVNQKKRDLFCGISATIPTTTWFEGLQVTEAKLKTLFLTQELMLNTNHHGSGIMDQSNVALTRTSVTDQDIVRTQGSAPGLHRVLTHSAAAADGTADEKKSQLMTKAQAAMKKTRERLRRRVPNGSKCRKTEEELEIAARNTATHATCSSTTTINLEGARIHFGSKILRTTMLVSEVMKMKDKVELGRGPRRSPLPPSTKSTSVIQALQDYITIHGLQDKVDRKSTASLRELTKNFHPEVAF